MFKFKANSWKEHWAISQLKGSYGKLTSWMCPLGVILLMVSPPAFAEEANFGSHAVAPGFSADTAIINGFTGGSYSLSALSNRDHLGNSCLGYGDSRPDYVLTLEGEFPSLLLSVDSGGADTTLLLKGPEKVWCGNDIDELNLDAQILGEGLKAGDYSLWIGTMAPGDRQNYSLTLSEIAPE